MDALSVVTQLRDLASEPQNREAIVQDQGCLPGLVLFLDHQDPQVLFATLQVGLTCYWPLATETTMTIKQARTEQTKTEMTNRLQLQNELYLFTL